MDKQTALAREWMKKTEFMLHSAYRGGDMETISRAIIAYVKASNNAYEQAVKDAEAKGRADEKAKALKVMGGLISPWLLQAGRYEKEAAQQEREGIRNTERSRAWAYQLREDAKQLQVAIKAYREGV